MTFKMLGLWATRQHFINIREGLHFMNNREGLQFINNREGLFTLNKYAGINGSLKNQ